MQIMLWYKHAFSNTIFKKEKNDLEQIVTESNLSKESVRG